jgi:hypothetical protein
MISFFITMSSMIFVFLYAIQSRNREYISYHLKKGMKCYSCKSDIESVMYDFSDAENYRQCKSCYRESQLNSVLKKPFISKRFIISNKFSMIGLGCNMISASLNLLSISVWKPLGIIGSLFLFMGMTIFYIHYISISKKIDK